MTSYMFRLTEIKIDETRSNFWDGLGITGHDTDTATLAVQVGDQLFPPVSKFLGDLSKGHTYPVGLAVGPIEVNPGDDIVVSYLVVNHGYPLSSEATGLAFVNFLSDAAAAVCTALYGAGAAWQELNTGTKALNAVFFADCDGICAGDKYVLKGADLPPRPSAARLPRLPLQGRMWRKLTIRALVGGARSRGRLLTRRAAQPTRHDNGRRRLRSDGSVRARHRCRARRQYHRGVLECPASSAVRRTT